MVPVLLPALPSYLPWLHDHYSFLCYYGGSDPGRPFIHRPPWFPNSRHQNFPPFCLQPFAVFDQTRPLPLRWPHYFVRTSPFASRLAKTAYRIEFTSSTYAGGLCYGLVVHFQLLSTRGYRPGAVTFSYWLTVSARSGTFTLLFQCALRHTSEDLAQRVTFLPVQSIFGCRSPSCSSMASRNAATMWRACLSVTQ